MRPALKAVDRPASGWSSRGKRLLAGAFALVASFVGLEARAASPFLEVPLRDEVEQSPAYRYSNMTNEEAFAELDRRGILYSKLGQVHGVRAPVRLTGRLHGVLIRSSLPPEERATTPFEILDARLALALDDFSVILAKHDVTELVHYTMYRPNVPAPQASPGALASRPSPPANTAPGRDEASVAGRSPTNPPSTSPARAGAPTKGTTRSAPTRGTAKRRTDAKSTKSEKTRPIASGTKRKAAPDEAPIELDLEEFAPSCGHDHVHHDSVDGDRVGEEAPSHDGPAPLGAKSARPAKRTPTKPAGRGPTGATSAAARSGKPVAKAAPRTSASPTGRAQKLRPVAVLDEKPHGKWAPPGTRHPAGLAIDVGALIKRDGTTLSVASHFRGKIGDRTCGVGAPVPETAEARELREIVCGAREAGVFTYALTPNYDAPHADHFHMEIKPGVAWFLYH